MLAELWIQDRKTKRKRNLLSRSFALAARVKMLNTQWFRPDSVQHVFLHVITRLRVIFKNGIEVLYSIIEPAGVFSRTVGLCFYSLDSASMGGAFILFGCVLYHVLVQHSSAMPASESPNVPWGVTRTQLVSLRVLQWTLVKSAKYFFRNDYPVADLKISAMWYRDTRRMWYYHGARSTWRIECKQDLKKHRCHQKAWRILSMKFTCKLQTFF